VPAVREVRHHARGCRLDRLPDAAEFAQTVARLKAEAEVACASLAEALRAGWLLIEHSRRLHRQPREGQPGQVHSRPGPS
jgi:hypothetical protein